MDFEKKDNLEKIKSGIDNIIREKIEKVSRGEESVREKARKDSSKTLKELEDHRLSEYDKEGKLLFQEIVTESKLFHKKQYLSAKSSLIDSVYDDVISAVKSLKKDDFRKFTAKLLKNTVKTGKEKISVSDALSYIDEEFISRMNSEEKWSLEYMGADKDIKGGFILKEKDYETIVSWDNVREYIKSEYEYFVINSIFGNA